MFKCQKCGKQSKTYEGQTKVVLETRPKIYENVIRRGRKSFTVRSEGSEIVKEIAVGPCCAESKAS
jgi:hypothetical protein